MNVKNLYLTKNEPIWFEVAQGAAGVQFGIRVQDYTIPAGAVVNIYVSKPDGTMVYNAAEVSGNTITVTTTTQMTAVVGVSNCQVQILSTGILLRTFVFHLKVRESIIDESAIESTDEFGALETALQTISQYDADILALQGDISDLQGDISAITSQIGSLEYLNFSLTYQSGETALELVQRAYANSLMPKGRAFIATINSGSVYTVIGHWYVDTSYGYCIIQNFASAHYIRLDNGTWVDTDFGRTRTSSFDIKIGSGPTSTATIRKIGKVRILNFYYYSDNVVGTFDINTAIGTVPVGDRPYLEESSSVSCMTVGAWATALYFEGNILINSSGNLYLRGKSTDLATCRAFRGQIVWVVA